MRNIIVLSSLMALGLAGCGGGGTTAPTIDMSAATGAGTALDPYVMPTHIPAGTNGGMEDYLSQTGGVWKYNINWQEPINLGTTPISLKQIVYDSTNDTWTVWYKISATSSVSGGTLRYDSSTGNYSGCLPGETCSWPGDTDLMLFDKSASASQYGTFGYAHFDDLTSYEVFDYFITGLATDVANMPASGTAVYSGDFEVTWLQGGWFYRTTGGKIGVNADFSLGTLDIVTTTPGTFNGETNDATTSNTYAIYGNATISGNSFVDTGFYGEWRSAGGTLLDNYTGTLVGAFYGPSADELAGSFQQTNTSGTTTVVGGLWAAQ